MSEPPNIAKTLGLPPMACTCDRDEKNPAVIREFAADCPIHGEEVEGDGD